MKQLLLYLFLLFCGISFTSFTPVDGQIATVQQKDTVVYETKTGKRYHRASCHYLRQSKIKSIRAQAEKRGLTPCKVCKP